MASNPFRIVEDVGDRGASSRILRALTTGEDLLLLSVVVPMVGCSDLRFSCLRVRKREVCISHTERFVNSSTKKVAEPSTCPCLYEVRYGDVHLVIVLKFRARFGSEWKVSKIPNDSFDSQISASPGEIVTRHSCAMR